MGTRETLRERFRRLEPLLDRALELEGAERDAFVRTCCEVHPDLADDLRRAISVDAQTLPGLGALAADAVRDRSTDRRNLRAGPWRLIERLGRGGMGTVYMAERADGAFDKRVAVKLLRGQDLRFKDHLERERQVLARLDHPAIARLIDGGVLADGQPFLVMELADGEDLDAWMRARQPSLARRLQVFCDVCAAVAYAHSHLVVHRDLKPSNIRVDAQDRVKLLDFGIAKLLDADAARGETRNMALTPEFAAPEQLEGGAITTRTDLYALGCLLHLLLVGRSPHPRFDGNWAAMVDAVCRHDVAAPSVTAAREDAPSFPPSMLRGDLDAIVLKALSRDPAQRYASAESLAEDVRRFRDGRPVRARALTAGYQFSRWFRRNWLPASLALSAFLLLAGASALMAWQARQIAAERDVARLESQRSQAVREYLMLMFRDAADTAPDLEQLRARDLLESGAERIDRVFADDAEGRQSVLSALGELYVSLGDYAGAEPLLRKLLDEPGVDPALRARGLIDLGLVLARRGEPAEACASADTALAALATEPGDQRALRADAQMVRGQCLRMQGDAAGSIAAYERAVELNRAALGDGDFRTAAAENNLATGLLHGGRYDEASLHFERAMAGFEAAGYPVSDHMANVLNNLAAVALFRGQLVQAEEYFRRALAVRDALGVESSALGALLSNYARVLTLRHRLDDAAPLLERAEALTVRFTGEDSVDTAAIRLAVADHAIARGDDARAKTAIAKAREAMVAKLGPSHPFVARADLAEAERLAARGRNDAAARAFDASVAAFEQAGPAVARYLSQAQCRRAQFRLQTGDIDGARADADACLALQRQLAGDDSWETANAQALAAAAAWRTQPDDAAAQRHREAVARVADTLGDDHPRVALLRALIDRA